MSSRVYEMPEEEWTTAIAQYLADKYPEIPDEVNVIVIINRRTKAMTVKVES